MVFTRILRAAVVVATIGVLVLPVTASAATALASPPEVRPPGWTWLGPDDGVMAAVCKKGPYPADGFKLKARREHKRAKYIDIRMTVPTGGGNYDETRIGEYSMRFSPNKMGPIKSYAGYSLHRKAIIHFYIMGVDSNPYTVGNLGFQFNQITRCP